MSMQRIFYFSGYRMKVFDWNGRRLVGHHDFEPSQEGFENFELFLSEAIRLPSKLLVDMIEESFRRESIPHVNFRDRKHLLDRLVERHYRDEDYVSAKIVGRSKHGRRDDQVLLSALTNTSLLKPWLDRLADHSVRLAGIWSQPLLTNRLWKDLFRGEKETLIVSRQIPSALRETYFHQGGLFLSRQAKFDREIWDDNVADIVGNLERGADEIYNFLINQRILGQDDQLEVHCILPEEQALEATALLKQGSESVHYEFIGLETLCRRYKLEGCEGYAADALFSFLCTKESFYQDHYSKNYQRRAFFRDLIDRVITQGAEIGTLIFATAAVLLALDGMEASQKTASVETRTAMMREEYNSRFGMMEQQLADAYLLEKSVQILNTLERDASQSLQDFFAPLSSVLGQDRYRHLQLDHIDWQKHTVAELAQIVMSQRQRQGADGAGLELSEFNDDYSGDGNETIVMRQPVLNLRGHISQSADSYSDTVDGMRELLDDLADLPGVTQVLPVRMPVDVRDSAVFSDQLGSQAEQGADNNASTAFEIMVILEAAKNA